MEDQRKCQGCGQVKTPDRFRSIVSPICLDCIPIKPIRKKKPKKRKLTKAQKAAKKHRKKFWYLYLTEEQRRYYNRRRQKAQRQATPSWANKAAMKKIYEEAKAQGLHVDHIVPIQHEKVCGLHCEFNLQLLTPRENRAKSNKFKVR